MDDGARVGLLDPPQGSPYRAPPLVKGTEVGIPAGLTAPGCSGLTDGGAKLRGVELEALGGGTTGVGAVDLVEVHGHLRGRAWGV
jgi:hypothetical protein